MKFSEDIKKNIREGRGQGTGAGYKPWINVQDLSSRGQSNREFGYKAARQYELLSQLELYFFWILEWSLKVIDIREQFPLLSPNKLVPLESTVSIAKHCNITHPFDRRTKQPRALTTDFLITIAQPIGTITHARTIKPSSELSKNRVIEKFEIERRYWREKGVDWAIVTEQEIDLVLVKNIKWIYKYIPISSLYPLTDENVRRISATLTRMVTDSDGTLSDIALECDDRLGLEAGQSLSIARHLIGSRQWHVDMTKQIHPCRRLDILGVSFAEVELKKASGE